MKSDSRELVLIVGGGVAALEALLALRSLAGDRVAIELHAPRREFVYRAMAVAEPFGLGEVARFDLGTIAEENGAAFRADGVSSVEPEQHQVALRGGEHRRYDQLLIACGAKMQWSVPGALTFWGKAAEGAFSTLLDELEREATSSVLFTMPAGFGWPLPLYELALLTSAHLAGHGADGVRVGIVTPEDAPLQLFGVTASEQIADLLAKRGIQVQCGRYPVGFQGGRLKAVPGEAILADRVVSLPHYVGRALPGLPHDQAGFIPVDAHGRVRGLEDVYAAGDTTDFPVKQGGLAAQQADAVAAAIAARIGLEVEAKPFRPTLRGMLLTGDRPRYLRGELYGGAGDTSTLSDQVLWRPRGKVAGKHLAPLLVSLAGEQALAPTRAPATRTTEIVFERDQLLSRTQTSGLDPSKVGNWP